MPELPGYPPLHTLTPTGDGRSIALLGPAAEVEWLCPGRFDAAPVIWPLLDRNRGGHLHIAPVDCVCTGIRYLPDTAVLRYEWAGSLGRARMTVAMLWPLREDGTQELLWLVEGISGRVSVEVKVEPRPDWDQQQSFATLDRTMAAWTTEDMALQLTGPVPLERFGHAAIGNGMLYAGQRWGLRLRIAPTAVAPSFATSADEVAADLEATGRAWRTWSEGLRYHGPWRGAVVRSAITLKTLIYEPTGAVVAAATTSLPERLGGQRNWDYRYTWLRDAGFTLNALHQLGCRHEASAYARWLCRTTAAHGPPLRVLYGIDGRTDLTEAELPELDGYRGSRPVRVGNAAESQLQLDSYGELLDCLTTCETMNDQTMRSQWPHFARLVDFAADHWREPDQGIWEVRSHPRHFVHSKALAWTALDRGCRLIEALDLPGDYARWQTEADRLKAQVLSRGVRDGHFIRAYDDPAPDAALLMLPIVGFIDGTDPIMKATIDTIRDRLTVPNLQNPGLLWRYPPADGQASPDGLAGTEGAFALCSFWLVEALALAGRTTQAEDLFTRLCDLAEPLGSLAEEIDPATGNQLGNTPQAFTHIGLISAALRLAGTTAKGTRRPPTPATAAPRGNRGDL